MFFLFVALFKRSNQVKFIEKVQKIDNAIRYNFKMDIDYALYTTVTVVILVIVFAYYNIVVTSVLYFVLLRVTSLTGIITFIVYIIQSGTSGIFTYGYVCYVALIRARLTKINKALEAIVRFPPEILEKRYKTKEALCKELMRYTKMYKSLCSCVEDLNDIFGTSMVLHFAHDFTLLTTQIFAIFYIGLNPDQNMINKIVALIVWLLPNITKMSFICFNCHMTRNEVKTLPSLDPVLTLKPFFRSKPALCTCENSATRQTKTKSPTWWTCSRFSQSTSKPSFRPTISSPSTCRCFSQ